MTTNKTNKIFALIFLVTLQITLSAQDQDNYGNSSKIKHSINMCPFGIVFGIYSANYEYLLANHHGIVARIDYEAIPNSYSNADINSDGKGGLINYRYHFSGKMESFYLGSFVRYRVYNGDGTTELEKFDFEISDITIGLNTGKKWVWESGFNINFTLGYGINSKTRTMSSNAEAVKDAINVFEDEYDFINGFMGELSIGYAF